VRLSRAHEVEKLKKGHCCHCWGGVGRGAAQGCDVRVARLGTSALGHWAAVTHQQVYCLLLFSLCHPVDGCWLPGHTRGTSPTRTGYSFDLLFADGMWKSVILYK